MSFGNIWKYPFVKPSGVGARQCLIAALPDQLGDHERGDSTAVHKVRRSARLAKLRQREGRFGG